MINLPSNWKKMTSDDGSQEKLPPGPYLCQITGVMQQKSRNGNDMLVLGLDVAAGKYQGIFTREFHRRKQAASDGKAKYPCLFYQILDADRFPRLKHIIKVIAAMNQPFPDPDEWNGDETTLKGRKVGVMFRGEEFLGNNGDVLTAVKPDRIDVWDNIKDKEPPPVKRLKSDVAAAPPQSDYYKPGDDDDDVPF